MRYFVALFLFLSNLFVFNNAYSFNRLFYDNFLSTTEVVLRPYVGVGYGLSYDNNVTDSGISYNNLLPNLFNSFGGHIGVRTKYTMVEFSTYGSLPSNYNGGASYGISSSHMSTVTMRLSGILTLHSDMFGNENNLLLICGMNHAFSNISYSVNNSAQLPTGLQYSVFGTHIEFGIGYMRDLSEHFSIRTDIRYSPISLSGVTNMMVTWNVILIGLL